MMYDDSDSSSEAGWIDWFCDLEGHEFFVTVSTPLNDISGFDRSTLNILETALTYTG